MINLLYFDMNNFRKWLEGYETMGSVSRTTREPRLPANIRDEAEKLRIDFRQLVGLANDIRNTYNEHSKRVNLMLRDARVLMRKHPDVYGDTSKQPDGGDYDKIRGFDKLAQEMAIKYTDVFGGSGYNQEEPDQDHSVVLWHYLQSGEVPLMSRDQALEKALERVYQSKRIT